MMRSIRGKEKLSFWACSVDVSEVDAEPPLSVCFFDEYDVGQPFRIFHLSDRPCLEKLVDLLVDCFLPLWREAPSLLLDWIEGWADVQPIRNYCGVNSSHIRLLPCKDVFVLSQEMGKEASEVFRKLGANVGEVFRVVVQRYRLQLFLGLRLGVHLVAHVELVQVYVINRFFLHGCRVEFPGHTLVSLNHSYSAYSRKFDHHVVSGGNDFYCIEKGSS